MRRRKNGEKGVAAGANGAKIAKLGAENEKPRDQSARRKLIGLDRADRRDRQKGGRGR